MHCKGDNERYIALKHAGSGGTFVFSNRKNNIKKKPERHYFHVDSRNILSPMSSLSQASSCAIIPGFSYDWKWQLYVWDNLGMNGYRTGEGWFMFTHIYNLQRKIYIDTWTLCAFIDVWMYVCINIHLSSKTNVSLHNINSIN